MPSTEPALAGQLLFDKVDRNVDHLLEVVGDAVDEVVSDTSFINSALPAVVADDGEIDDHRREVQLDNHSHLSNIFMLLLMPIVLFAFFVFLGIFGGFSTPLQFHDGSAAPGDSGRWA